jgi:cell wall-associated NlpC family hydrolase
MRLSDDGSAADASVQAAAAPRQLSLPEPPAPAAPAPGNFAEPATQGALVPRVPRPHKLVEATLLVTTRTPLSDRTIKAINHVDGVTRTHSVAAGKAHVDGHRALVLGVDPAGFRAWTPPLTAKSQPLWQSIARGELTASFDMGHEAALPLGSTVPVRAASRAPIRIGAFASVGMAGVDAVVSPQRAAEIGLQRRTGLVVSAPQADALDVRRAVHDIIAATKDGEHAHTSLLREVVVIRDAGEFLTRVQINTMLQAAASRVGKPYVWGATGPNSFDCSGLVQWSFAQAGIRMPRVSQQQWFAGPHISYADALPGDLLFWHYDPTDRSNIDHVAIYAGKGMMLVAPHTGDFVKYVPVPLTQFAGVVRVDPGVASQIG